MPAIAARHLTKEAAQAGLLSDAEIEKLLREEIRRRATNELFEATEGMAAVEGAPMTEEEIQAEIDAVRAVADTNTVVSGLLWTGAPRALLIATRAGKLRLYFKATDCTWRRWPACRAA